MSCSTAQIELQKINEWAKLQLTAAWSPVGQGPLFKQVGGLAKGLVLLLQIPDLFAHCFKDALPLLVCSPGLFLGLTDQEPPV